MTQYRVTVTEWQQIVAVHDGLTEDEMRAREAHHLGRGRAVEVFAYPGGAARHSEPVVVVLEQLVFPGFGAGAIEGGHNGRSPAAADVHEPLRFVRDALCVAGGV